MPTSGDGKHLDWKVVVGSFLKLRNRGAVTLLAVGLLAIAPTFWVVAYHATSQTVQIVVLSGGVVSLLAFFGAVSWAIDRLGVFALLESTQVVTYRKMDLAAKNQPSISPTPAIADPNPPLLIESSTAQDGEEN